MQLENCTLKSYFLSYVKKYVLIILGYFLPKLDFYSHKITWHLKVTRVVDTTVLSSTVETIDSFT